MFFSSSPAQRGQGGEDERHWAAVIRVFRYGHAMDGASFLKSICWRSWMWLPLFSRLF